MPKSLREKLQNNELTIGSWVTIGSPFIAEVMAKAGFDWLTVDMEHSAITLHQAQQIIQVVELCGVTPLARVGENNPALIKRVMDAGAHGVIVPMVNTADDARRAVAAAKYPPLGSRGVGLARAQGYGLDFERYKIWVAEESMVIVQIEHITAIENLEKILAVDGVDAFIVGPYDLSGSIGCPGDFDHPEMVSALRKVLEVSKKLHKTAGFHVILPDAADATRKVSEGYRFIGFSLDTLFLGYKCRTELRSLVEKVK